MSRVALVLVQLKASMRKEENLRPEIYRRYSSLLVNR